MVDPAEYKKRLKRLAGALAGKGLDPATALRAVPQLRDAALSDEPIEGQPDVGRNLVEHRRWTDRTTPQPRMTGNLNGPLRTHRGPISGPLPDPAWDRLFGALQVAELQAAAQGKRFGVDYGGFGQDASETYAPQGLQHKPFDDAFQFNAPGHTSIRQRILDPAAESAARQLGSMQAQSRRRR